MSKISNRYALTAAAVVVLAGGAIATASPAQALDGPITTFTATSTALTATDIDFLSPLGPVIPFPVSISRLVHGSAQVVASGRGSAVYQCDGSAVNTYTAVGKQLTVPCG
jgi:hypothetical protein